MAAAATQPATQPSFPWESPLASGPFWDSLTAPSATGQNQLRTVAQLFPRIFSAAEAASLPLDASLSKAGKLQLLERILGAKRDSLETSPDDGQPRDPASLLDEAWRAWQRCVSGLAALAAERGALQDCVDAYRAIVAAARRRSPENPELSAEVNLQWTLAQMGRYGEAEQQARETLPLLRAYPLLGPDSPQVLGNIRLLAEVVAKQGREEDARKWVEEGWRVVGQLKEGKFKKYGEEEDEAMREVEENIPKWVKEAERRP